MFKSARPNRLLILILWVIAIFIAIVKLPSITTLITNVNDQINPPSQVAQSEQLINAHRLQHGWGRRLGHTSTVNLVYNRRSGQITSRQQVKIDHRVNHLQKHANEYGIKKITDLNSNRNGADQLKSKDNSTEIVQLSVNRKYQGVNANVWADEIKGLTQIPTLRSAVTSPSLLYADSVRKTVHLTVMITVISFVLLALVMGIMFKSVVIPIISSVTLLITDLITLSITSHLAQWTGFNEYTPLAILLITLIIGSVTTYVINQAIIPELPNHRDANNAVRVGLAHVKRPVELSGIILTLAFGSAILIPEVNVRSIALLGINAAVITLAELTLIPTFIAWLGDDILWPSHHYELPSGHKLWNRLTRLSLWQPMIGIIAVVYFVVPFAYSYRNNFKYTPSSILPSHGQAYLGSNLLNAHFTEGKSTPVTVYIKNPQKFNHERTLKPLDDLTTKLQSMPGVNAVYSLTQPSSMPINKYYVNHQLNAVDDSLNQNQDQLSRAEQLIKHGQKKLGKHRLNQINQRLDQLKAVKGNIPTVDKLTTTGQKSKVTNQLTRYNNQIQSLNDQLNQLSDGLNNVNEISNDAQSYQKQLQSVRKKMTSTTKRIQRVNNSLNTLYSYLSSLQRSSASHQYFITPDQIQDTDFQQSLLNTTSQDERITKLQVVFNQTPSTRYNQTRLHQLTNEIKDQLQGTSLSHAKVALSGVPVQQATIQHNFKRGAIKALLISLGVITLGLILISRSVLHPLFWLLSFIISGLSGLQITELIIRFTTHQPLVNWQIMLSTLPILTGIGAVELVPLSLAYRPRRTELTEWLHETFTSLGQTVAGILIITIFTAIGLLTGMTYQTGQMSLIIISTVIIFNWVLPTLASALGKYAKTLPHSRL